MGATGSQNPLNGGPLARLAAQYAGRGVYGFGLSNDERRGVTAEFEPAFAIARRARARASSGCRVRLAAMMTPIPIPVTREASATESRTRSVNAVMPPNFAA